MIINYQVEYKGQFITVQMSPYGLDMFMTYPDCDWDISSIEKIDELYQRVFDGKESGLDLRAAIRSTSAVIIKTQFESMVGA